MEPRRIASISLVLLITNLSIAQRVQNSSPEQIKLRKYKDMKGAGTIMVIFGGGVMIVGGVIELQQLNQSMSTMFTNEPEQEYNNSGTILFCTGAALVGGGIPLMIIGNRKYKLYKKSPEAISLGIKAHPHATGLSLTYRF